MSIATSSASASLDAALSGAGWAVALGVLGAIAGSFLGTVAVRWPQERAVSGRSACDACGRALAWWELVPLASWAMAHGRCRACGAAIDWRHPLIEGGCAAIGVASASLAPGWAGLAGAAFGWLLLTLAVIDATDLWLPDPLVLALALTGLASTAVAPPALADRLIGGAAGFASLWLIAALYRRWRGREGLGQGDAKLLGAIGLWLGWRLLPAVLVIAALTGLGIALLRLLTGHAAERDDEYPLGTFLSLAAYPAWLAMVTWSP